jgi:hypothetical protein
MGSFFHKAVKAYSETRRSEPEQGATSQSKVEKIPIRLE